MTGFNLPPGGGFTSRYLVTLVCPECDHSWDAIQLSDFGATYFGDARGQEDDSGLCPECGAEGDVV